MVAIYILMCAIYIYIYIYIYTHIQYITTESFMHWNHQLILNSNEQTEKWSRTKCIYLKKYCNAYLPLILNRFHFSKMRSTLKKLYS